MYQLITMAIPVSYKLLLGSYLLTYRPGEGRNVDGNGSETWWMNSWTVFYMAWVRLQKRFAQAAPFHILYSSCLSFFVLSLTRSGRHGGRSWDSFWPGSLAVVPSAVWSCTPSLPRFSSPFCGFARLEGLVSGSHAKDSN